MNWELDTILEQSISQMADGKARVESCLLAYPAHADELAPLLVASEELLALPKPSISPAAVARIEEQLFEAAAASGLVRRERKPLVLPRIPLPRWRWAYSAIAAAVIVVFLLTSTFVGTANALPGSPFYPVKLATEEVWLWVAPARDEPALHLRFAQRRLQEYQELAEQGVYDESVLDAMTAHVDAALDGIEELPPAIALELLDTVAEVVAVQQQVLAAMQADPPADMPASAKLQLDRILADTLSQIARVDVMRLSIEPFATGTPLEESLTIVPTATAEPSGILAATATPTSTSLPGETEEAPTPTSTMASGGTQPGEPTSIVPTATPVPPETETPPTDTPPPPPTDTPVEPTPTKKTPPGLTKTPLPPGIVTRTPNP